MLDNSSKLLYLYIYDSNINCMWTYNLLAISLAAEILSVYKESAQSEV